MTYEEIYSQFYTKNTDHTFFEKYSKDEAYEVMKNWLHSIAAFPYVRNKFFTITLDDEILDLKFVLKNPIDEISDSLFVKDIFSQGLVMCWTQQKVDNIVNIATVIGGREEKVLLNNYKDNIERLNSLEVKLRKTIRDYGYTYNDYIGDE